MGSTSRWRARLAAFLVALSAAATITVHEAASAHSPHDGWVRVSHQKLRQPTTWDCAPTSVAMMLGTRGVTVDPMDLAEQMGSRYPSGTMLADILRVANAHQGSGWQLVSQSVGSTQLMVSDLLVSLRAGVAVPEAVMLDLLPWDEGGTVTGHVILVDGVNQRTGEVSVYDPQTGPAGGQHVMRASDLYAALQRVFQPAVTQVMVDERVG